jgi:hypothetical protein
MWGRQTGRACWPSVGAVKPLPMDWRGKACRYSSPVAATISTSPYTLFHRQGLVSLTYQRCGFQSLVSVYRERVRQRDVRWCGMTCANLRCLLSRCACCGEDRRLLRRSLAQSTQPTQRDPASARLAESSWCFTGPRPFFTRVTYTHSVEPMNLTLRFVASSSKPGTHVDPRRTLAVSVQFSHLSI